MSEKQLHQPAETTTMTSLTTLLNKIDEHIKKGTQIETNFIDEDLTNPNQRIGCKNPLCKDGYIMLENGTMDYCDCYKKERFRIKLVKAGIPEEYYFIKKIDEEGLRCKQKMYAADYVELKDININTMLSNYKKNIHSVKNEGWNFILEGPTGSGKTTAACICIKYAINAGFSALFLELQDLRKMWTGEKLDEHLEYAKSIMHSVDFLILDDLGQEFVSERSEHQITELDLLLRHRVSKKRCTIFTTNARYEQITTRYGERISSLLKKRMVHVIMNREIDMRDDKEIPAFLQT